MNQFEQLWQDACAEQEPNPHPEAAAGRLMAAMGSLLDASQVEFAKMEGVAVFLLDLGSLGFKGLDFNVVMVSHPPQTEGDARRQAELMSDYRTVVKSDGLCFQVFLCDAPPAKEFETLTANTVRVFGPDVRRLFESKVPAVVWFEVIRRQVPLRRLCPYNTTHAARGPMFRGRRDELDDLVSDLDTNIVVSGARRIGKTSLLTRAYDVLRARPDFRDRVFFFNCLTWGNVNDCFGRLAHAVDPRRERRIDHSPRNISYLLERRSWQGTRPLLLFFDELDRVVEADQCGWEFFKVLAEASHLRRIRVVFAGYRSMAILTHGRTVRQEHGPTAPDSPFYGELREVGLEPLGQTECHALITEPFQRMQISIRQQDTVLTRIWGATAGHPFFVQFFGERLFQASSRRHPQQVDVDDVSQIERGAALNDFLVTHFLENTLHQGTPMETERLCALLLAQEPDGCEWAEADFVTAFEKLKRPAGWDDIHKSLRNLRLASMLSYHNSRYRFALPLLRRVLRQTYPPCS